ncbi:VOC family protein [Bacteroidota bacterium]
MNVKIEHVAFWVSDLEAMKVFYIKYFSGKASSLYKSKSKDFQSYFIAFESGARIELMKMPEFEKTNEKKGRGYSHVAFSIGSKEKVDELTTRMEKDGIMVQSQPRYTGDGYYESVIIDIEDNIVEITE